MARYEGRHRNAPAPETTSSPRRASSSLRPVRSRLDAPVPLVAPPVPTASARPILAGVLAVGLGASGFAYAKANDLIGTDASAFVVGSGVVAQTDEMARA